jgi:DNA polymerase III alpha subunit
VKTDNYGRVSITEQEAFEALYSGKLIDLNNVTIDGDVTQYNQSREKNADKIFELRLLEDLEFENIIEFDKANQSNWFMPKEYYDFEIVGFLLDKTSNETEYQRVVTELELFIQHNMLDLLKYLKYLVDTMRENNIVWGVGRGSSVASYVLYLLGVHKIDSIKYNLDIEEFLKKGE